MKSKIVYTLTSDENDIFLEQVIFSAYSLKKYNPDTYILLVVDSVTESTFVGDRKNIHKYIDELLSFNAPIGFNKRDRSRWLKTNLRELIQGDYIFIDSDTCIVGNLEDIEKNPNDICAVLDRHVTLDKNPRFELILNQFTKFGWTPDDKDLNYFNSGVMLVRDTDTTHKLYQLWNTFWNESRNKGLSIDQPALAKANAKLNYVIKELSGIWNCQIMGNGLRYVNDAKIIHFYNSASRDRLSNTAYLLTDKKVFLRIRSNKYQITKEEDSLIPKAKGLFAPVLEIYSSEKLSALYSLPMIVLFEIYTYHKKFFRVIERLSSIYIKLRNVVN